MKTLEATMRELVTDNRAALEKSLADNREALADNRVTLEQLRTSIFRAVIGGMVASVTILGGIIAILAFLLQPGG